MTKAGNPWLALPDGGPSASQTRRLRAAHERLVTTCGLPADSVQTIGHPVQVFYEP